MGQTWEEDGEIIPYQEIIGNYSQYPFNNSTQSIIPYQEIIGNYSAPEEH